jgi:5-methylcytosine-specific restriction enzyme A
MTRTVEEWIGATPDTRVPPRVRLRVFYRDSGICQCGCGQLIRAGQRWQTDHTIALINGGENRERNLRTLLVKHHAAKTREDVAQKSKDYRVRAKHNGVELRRGPKIQSAGFAKRPPQRTASRPIVRHNPS